MSFSVASPTPLVHKKVTHAIPRPARCCLIAAQTRGALTFTSDEYPGAFLKDKGISYVTVAGAALMGDKDAPRRSRARFAYG